MTSTMLMYMDMESQRRREGRKRNKKILEEIMAENFLNLIKTMS